MAQFSVPLSLLAEKVKLDVQTVARKATFDLFNAVILRSPVDTGRFRANWNVSYGEPDVTASDSVDQARSAAEAEKALTMPIGGIAWLANGLPYAKELEDGSSRQAPNGMVKLSAQEFAAFVQRAVSK